MTVNLAYFRSLEGGVDDSGVSLSPTSFRRRSPRCRRTSMPRRPTRRPVCCWRTSSSGRTRSMVSIERRRSASRSSTTPMPKPPAGSSAPIRACTLRTATGSEPVRGSFDPARCAGRLRPRDRVTGDAAAYAGRARALDLLRSRDAALEAQREAVRLNPASVPWRLRLAQLEGCTGQVGAWRHEAQTAFAAAASAKDPAAVATRSILADPPARDFGTSYRQRPADLDVTLRVPATGSTIVALDPFPEPETCLTGDATVATAVDERARDCARPVAADNLPGHARRLTPGQLSFLRSTACRTRRRSTLPSFRRC